MTEPVYRFGYIPSDANSVAFPSVRGINRDGRRAAAASSDLRPHVEAARAIGASKGQSAIFDQGDSGSCVAQSCAMAWRTRLFVLAGQDEKKLAQIDAPSRLVGYLGARRVSGDANWDNGTQIQAWFDYAERLGLPPENDPSLNIVFDPARVLEHLKPDGVPVCDRADVQRAANDYKLLDGVHRIDQGLGRLELMNAIDEALTNGEPVVFGVPLDQSFFSLSPGSVYRRERPLVGLHAMCLVGHDKNNYRVANSWGEGWCEGGFGLLSKAWVLDEANDIHRFGLLEPW